MDAQEMQRRMVADFQEALARPVANIYEVQRKWDDVDNLGPMTEPVRQVIDAAHADLRFLIDKWAIQVNALETAANKVRARNAKLEATVQQLAGLLDQNGLLDQALGIADELATIRAALSPADQTPPG